MATVDLDIYIPFLPCACQPGKTDRRATAFNELLLELKERFKDRLSIGIYALNLHFQRFKDNPVLSGILQSQGQAGLPVICVNGTPQFLGAYPGLAELEAVLEPLLSQPSPSST
jgi:hypothetical protein